ncbi:Prpf4b [Symbiodinium natans]|uniref:Prpf4b protein n=1 Tax=Symbiodinium natans TaxID=878477 RepID=A0A812UGQ8_9DINO|nr:Prpf4b [Symbiodinium natans]
MAYVSNDRYTRQLLIALRHLHKCGIIHADIKPDNILISAGHNVVKICDLGSAMELTEVEPTPYLVSRFYRAPEIVLAAKYSFPLDVFAMGCTLFELFTGKILFPGKTNNDMLRLFMEVKGKLPNKLIKSGTVWKNHFDDNMDFKYFDVNKAVIRSPRRFRNSGIPTAMQATRKKITRTITDLSAKRTMSLPTIAEDEDRVENSQGAVHSEEEDPQSSESGEAWRHKETTVRTSKSKVMQVAGAETRLPSRG